MTDYFTYSVTSTGLVIPLTLTGITLNSGDTLDATEGGTAIDTTVNAGGSMSGH